jgi:hypothetical protein
MHSGGVPGPIAPHTALFGVQNAGPDSLMFGGVPYLGNGNYTVSSFDHHSNAPANMMNNMHGHGHSARLPAHGSGNMQQSMFGQQQHPAHSITYQQPSPQNYATQSRMVQGAPQGPLQCLNMQRPFLDQTVDLVSIPFQSPLRQPLQFFS